MKFLQAAVLALATPLHAFVPCKSASIRSSPQSQVGHRLQLVPGELPFGLGAVVESLDKVNFEISNEYQTQLNSLLNQVKTILSEESVLQTEFTSYLTNLSQEIDQWLLHKSPEAESLYQQLLGQLGSVHVDSPLAVALTTVVTYVVVSSALTWGQPPPPSKPYPLQRYDPIAAQVYFDGKAVEAASRGLEIAVKSLGFALSLLKDKVEYVLELFSWNIMHPRGSHFRILSFFSNKWEQNEQQRGKELANLLAELGPTFIKVGQSLSIRTDLLSPGYVRGLTSLQDTVPPFDTNVSKQIMEEEWGQPVDSVLSKISDMPVAAASLGQVFKATMKDGREVAIKVQRPNIMKQIALDMHLLREFAGPAKRIFNLNTDTVGTVDAWGAGFVDELDYLQEAQNGKYFMRKIQETPLKDVVLAPEIVDEFSTSKVLVTEWIDGERLDKSASEDVTILCSICMNTYLTMLLELGVRTKERSFTQKL